MIQDLIPQTAGFCLCGSQYKSSLPLERNAGGPFPSSVPQLVGLDYAFPLQFSSRFVGMGFYSALAGNIGHMTNDKLNQNVIQWWSERLVEDCGPEAVTSNPIAATTRLLIRACPRLEWRNRLEAKFSFPEFSGIQTQINSSKF